MMQGNGRLNDPFVEIPVTTSALKPEPFDHLMTFEEFPAVEKLHSFDQPFIDSHELKGANRESERQNSPGGLPGTQILLKKNGPHRAI